MADNKMICRVCGKEYDPCHTAKVNGAFRWQDVACCVEHGMEYLDRIRKSRMPQPEKAPVVLKRKTTVEKFEPNIIQEDVNDQSEVVLEASIEVQPDIIPQEEMVD